MNKMLSPIKLMLLVLTLGMSLTASAYDFTYRNVYYNILDANAKTVEVTQNPYGYSQEWVIDAHPSLNGVSYTTVAIGDSAFKNCTKLTKITLPGTITQIGAYAFYNCTSLEEPVIPEGVEFINTYAFCHCDKFVEFTLPNTVSTMGQAVFYSCENLETVHWSTALTNISSYTFYYCRKLKSFKIPHWIKRINYCAFTNSGLEEAIVPYGVTNINQYAFLGTPIRTALIPSSVTMVYDEVFKDCSQLETIYCNMTTPPAMIFENVPTTCKAYCPVNCVQQYAEADGWSNLSVEAGAYDFNYGEGYNASSVYHMTVTSNEPLYYNGAHYDGTAKYVYHPNITIARSFSPTMYETDLMCGSGKQYLITEVGDSCFYHSSANITSIDFSDSKALTRLGHDAFWSCNARTVTLPASVNSYGAYSLYYMPNLTDLTVNSPTPVPVPTNCFYTPDCNRVTLHVPTQAARTAYANAENWKRFFNITTEEPLVVYPVWIAGTRVTNANCNNITGPGITGRVIYSPGYNMVAMYGAHISNTTNANWPGIKFQTDADAVVYFSGHDNQIGDPDAYTHDMGIYSERSSIRIEGNTCIYDDHALSIYSQQYGIAMGGNSGQNLTTRIADCQLLIKSNMVPVESTIATNSTLEFSNCDAQLVPGNYYMPIEGFDNLDLNNCFIMQPAGGYWIDSYEGGYNTGFICDASGELYRGELLLAQGDTPVRVRGDVNADGTVDPADISDLIDHLLNGSAVNANNADCDLNGSVDPSDLSALVDYLLSNTWPASLMAPAKCKMEMPQAAAKGEILDMDMPEKVAPAEETKGTTIVLPDDKAI